MEDPQLELADVKAQYIAAEERLNQLAAEVQSAATARSALTDTSESVAGATSAFAETAAELAALSQRLANAATAIEQAEPGAVRDRLDNVDASLEKTNEALSSLQDTQNKILTLGDRLDDVDMRLEKTEETLSNVRSVQAQVRFFVVLTLLSAVAAVIVGIVLR